jgi:hypothetical protein
MEAKKFEPIHHIFKETLNSPKIELFWSKNVENRAFTLIKWPFLGNLAYFWP